MALRRVYLHLGLTFGSQLVLIAIQLGYLATVSRIIGPESFGAYAVAVMVTTLGNMLATGGLGQATARRAELEPGDLRSLASVGLLIGVVLAVATSLTAPLWGVLWSNASAVPLMVMLSVAMPALALGAVHRGALRRSLLTPAIARANVVGTLAGVVVGLVVVAQAKEAWALCVAPVVAAFATCVQLWWTLGKSGSPGKVTASAFEDASFGAKSGLSGLITYFSYGAPVWSTSTSLGPIVLGNWNRAIAVGQVPVDAATSSLSTVVFHRFAGPRGIGPVERTALLRASIIVLVPFTAILLPLIPTAVRFVLGNQWTLAPLMTPWVVLAAILTLHGSLLTMSLEAQADFKRLLLGQVMGAIVLVAGAITILNSRLWELLPLSFVAAVVVTHLAQVWAASRQEFIHGRGLVWPYLSSVMVGVAVYVESKLVEEHLGGGIGLWGNAVALAVIMMSIMWWRRDSWSLVPHKILPAGSTESGER